PATTGNPSRNLKDYAAARGPRQGGDRSALPDQGAARRCHLNGSPLFGEIGRVDRAVTTLDPTHWIRKPQQTGSAPDGRYPVTKWVDPTWQGREQGGGPLQRHDISPLSALVQHRNVKNEY